jgi:hypothetical protein
MLLATRPDPFLLDGLADAAFAIAFTKTLFEMPATPRGEAGGVLVRQGGGYTGRYIAYAS